MATIFHHVIIEAEKSRIFDAITQPRGLASWWIEDCTVEPKVGFMMQFNVHGHGTIKMKVIDLQPDRRVEWECCNDNDEWTGTRVLFEIVEKDNACALLFRHSGWKDQTNFFGTCNYHWGRHLAMLIQLCETGQSTLDQDTESNEVRKVTNN